MRAGPRLAPYFLSSAGLILCALAGLGLWFHRALAIIAAPAAALILLVTALWFNEIPWMARARAAHRDRSRAAGREHPVT